jgi:hypothetical protein
VKTFVRATAAGLAAALLSAAVAVAAQQPTQTVKPSYLAYAEFKPDDTPQNVALKRAYNDAVQRYNQSLYDYHVTLEKHDRLVETYNGSIDPVERKKAREEAEGLRGRLAGLRRDVTSRAALVDEAARRAAAGGVVITR